MINHTPGPWNVERTKDFSASYRVMDEQEVTVALFYQQPGDTWQAKDNAKLCAVAPELLDSLKEVISIADRPEDMFDEEGFPTEEWNSIVQCIRATFARAEGGRTR